MSFAAQLLEDLKSYPRVQAEIAAGRKRRERLERGRRQPTKTSTSVPYAAFVHALKSLTPKDIIECQQASMHTILRRAKDNKDVLGPLYSFWYQAASPNRSASKSFVLWSHVPFELHKAWQATEPKNLSDLHKEWSFYLKKYGKHDDALVTPVYQTPFWRALSQLDRIKPGVTMQVFNQSQTQTSSISLADALLLADGITRPKDGLYDIAEYWHQICDTDKGNLAGHIQILKDRPHKSGAASLLPVYSSLIHQLLLGDSLEDTGDHSGYYQAITEAHTYLKHKEGATDEQLAERMQYVHTAFTDDKSSAYYRLYRRLDEIQQLQAHNCTPWWDDHGFWTIPAPVELFSSDIPLQQLHWRGKSNSKTSKNAGKPVVSTVESQRCPYAIFQLTELFYKRLFNNKEHQPRHKLTTELFLWLTCRGRILNTYLNQTKKLASKPGHLAASPNFVHHALINSNCTQWTNDNQDNLASVYLHSLLLLNTQPRLTTEEFQALLLLPAMLWTVPNKDNVTPLALWSQLDSTTLPASQQDTFLTDHMKSTLVHHALAGMQKSSPDYNAAITLAPKRNRL